MVFPQKYREYGDSSGDSDFERTLQGHGRLNILCLWTGHNVGRHDGTLHDGAPPAHWNS